MTLKHGSGLDGGLFSEPAAPAAAPRSRGARALTAAVFLFNAIMLASLYQWIGRAGLFGGVGASPALFHMLRLGGIILLWIVGIGILALCRHRLRLAMTIPRA